MKITVLCENQAGHRRARVCLAEWGLSLFIETKGVNILLDAGNTAVYRLNAEKLKVNLEKTDFVVLSHHHWDHVGGLRYHNFKTRKRLIAEPETLKKIPSEQAEKIKADFDILTSEHPLEFSKGIYFLGIIPRRNSFEKGMFRKDKMRDDSAIALKSKKGAIVITGCSHSGICNICEYAKEITGQDLYAVIGGFHLFENEPETVNRTIKYFKAAKPELLYPMHCIDFPTIAKFHKIFGTQKLSTGDRIRM